MISLDLKPDRAPAGGRYSAADCELCGLDAASDCRAVCFKTLAENLTTLKTLHAWDAVKVTWQKIFPPSSKLVVVIVQPKTYATLGFICFDCMEKHVVEMRKIYGMEPTDSQPATDISSTAPEVPLVGQQ